MWIGKLSHKLYNYINKFCEKINLDSTHKTKAPFGTFVRLLTAPMPNWGCPHKRFSCTLKNGCRITFHLQNASVFKVYFCMQLQPIVITQSYRTQRFFAQITLQTTEISRRLPPEIPSNGRFSLFAPACLSILIVTH